MAVTQRVGAIRPEKRAAAGAAAEASPADPRLPVLPWVDSSLLEGSSLVTLEFDGGAWLRDGDGRALDAKNSYRDKMFQQPAVK